MLVFLPLLTFLLIGLIVRKASSMADRHSPMPWISASVLWAGVLLTLTEVLSIGHNLTDVHTATGWGGIAVLLVFVWFRTPATPHGPSAGIPSKPTMFDRFLLLCLLTIAALLLLTAVVSPPNNYDSMTYHLARVMHWIQNRSVDIYPTNIMRQIALSPFAEYIILHLQILDHHRDTWVNLVQWFSLIGACAGGMYVTRLCQGSTRSQLITGITIITIPMAILQASSTQNDLVASYWIVCAVIYLLRFRRDQRTTDGVLFAASCGFAVLTKTTAYAYLCPFVLWFAWLLLRRCPLRAAVSLGAIMTLTFAAINGMHFYRSYKLSGSIVGVAAPNVKSMVVSEFSLTRLTSILIKNGAQQLRGPIHHWNERVDQIVGKWHALLGIHVDHPATSYPLGTFFDWGGAPLMEDTSGSPIHFLLYFAVGMLSLCFMNKIRNKDAIKLALAAVTGFVLIAVLLKWSVWGARYHLPFLILFAPACILLVTQLQPPLRRISLTVLPVALIIFCLPWLFFNFTRPLLGERSILRADRNRIYFYRALGYHDLVTGILRRIEEFDCQTIGLDFEFDDWEYPLWVFARKSGNRQPRIEHVNIQNVSRHLREDAFIPCAVISKKTAPATLFCTNGQAYANVERFPVWSLFIKSPEYNEQCTAAPPSRETTVIPPQS